MTAMKRVALANDQHARNALQVLLKGWTEDRPELAPLVGSKQELERLVEESADLPKLLQADEASAARAILVQLAEDDAGAVRVDAALGERKKLIEPVTTALVLAGIVMLLSTEIEVDSKVVDGKRSTNVHIKKGPTSDSILGKLFSLFGG